MPYLPPAVIGLLLALSVFCGFVMLLGIRIRMRNELEPLSHRARRFAFGSVLFLVGSSYLIYRLARLALHA